MYNAQKAGEYWGKRIKETKNKHNAVLSYSLPDHINSAYDKWERTTIMNDLKRHLKKGAGVMDVGCGYGRVSLSLLKEGYHIYAVDVSKDALELFLKECDKQKLGHFEIFNRDCTDLPKTYPDAVLMLGVLEHLPENIKEKSIKHIYDTLEKGGRAYFVLNNNHNLFLRQQKRYKMKDQQPNGYFISLMNYQTVISFMESTGFEVSIISSNYHQSLAKNIWQDFIKKGKERDFFESCALLDTQKTVLDDDIVDQYIILAVKR